MILEIILGLLFIASLITIGFLGWYIRNLLNNLLYITENTIELQEEIISFKEHLGSIYELEMFYGEETLGGLLRHGEELLDSFEKFEYFYELLESGEQPEEPILDDQEEPNDDPANSPKTISQGKTVFYGSP